MQSDPFDEATLLDEARARAGHAEFADEGFRAPLRVLLASLAAAPLNGVGIAVLRTSIRRSLVQRLRADACFARHPEIERERIDAPVVIVGMMRSGTTLLQRLLARDPRFFSALGWEIAEPVPRPESEGVSPDPRIADGVERSRQMRELAPALHAIHPTDALEADEEIVFLADAFLSHVPEASCHVPVYRAWLDEQDFLPAYRYLERMLKLLQWQKRRRGEERDRWVLKTPAHLGYLETLFSVFPDAHVVHLHRDPIETVPSGASLNLTLWRLYADRVDPVVVGRQWLERMAWATRRALEARDRLASPDRFSDVAYRDAVRNPLARVAEIEADLGMAAREDGRAAMQRWLDREAAQRRPAHRYAAAQFGLGEAEIRDAFAAYLARFEEAVRPS